MRDTATFVVLTILLLLFSIGAVLATEKSESPLVTGYDLTRWTVDGGGAMLNGYSGYSLGATIGQPDAKVWQGGGYTLLGGFWGGAMVEYRLYLPLMLRNN